MYEKFGAVFHADPFATDAIASSSLSTHDADLIELLRVYGGNSFDNGLYRVIRADEVLHWSELIGRAFPAFNERITCFSMDWLGRVFAVDVARTVEERPGVVMFEPGTGEALEIPCNLESFHESELIEYRDAALAEAFHRQWLAGGGSSPGRDQCIGYKKLLFLGGEDKISNLEVSDLDVYWTIAAQLIRKTQELAQGASIGKVFVA